MPAHSFAAGGELRIAQAIPMQCITGDYSYDPIFPDSDPDVRLVPDYRTVKCTPWSSVPRAFAIHDCVELDGQPCAFAARSVLKGVLDRYTEQGLTPVVAPEIEFYLTAPNVDPDQPFTAPVARGGRAEAGQSAFSLNMLNALAPFWDAFRSALDGLDIQADTWIHEVGQSQYEINLMHGDPVAVADQAFLFKYAAKEIAIQHGLNAVFMAKPISGAQGSSMHLHQSVVDASGRNIFSTDDGAESASFRHFIAGLQTYVPDLMLIFAPFVNSYRRYVSGSQAPVNLGLRQPHHRPAHSRERPRRAPGREPHCRCGCQPLSGHCRLAGGRAGRHGRAPGAHRTPAHPRQQQRPGPHLAPQLFARARADGRQRIGPQAAGRCVRDRLLRRQDRGIRQLPV